MVSQELIYPIHVLPSSDAGAQADPGSLAVYKPLARELPCEVTEILYTIVLNDLLDLMSWRRVRVSARGLPR